MTEHKLLDELTMVATAEWTTTVRRLRLVGDCPVRPVVCVLHPDSEWPAGKACQAAKAIGLSFELAAQAVWAADGHGPLLGELGGGTGSLQPSRSRRRTWVTQRVTPHRKKRQINAKGCQRTKKDESRKSQTP